MFDTSDDEFYEPSYCVMLTFRLDLADLDKVRQWEQMLSHDLEGQGLGEVEGDEFEPRQKEMSVFLRGADPEAIYSLVREAALGFECISEVRAVVLPSSAEGDFALPFERRIK